MKLFRRDTTPPPPPPSTSPAPSSAGEKPAAAAPTIVGRWKEPKGSDTTEFHSDGTVTEKPTSGESIRGRYKMDGSTLKINLDGVPDELSFTAAVKDGKLEMTGPDGILTRYERAS
jgi:hypothetical protein